MGCMSSKDVEAATSASEPTQTGDGAPLPPPCFDPVRLSPHLGSAVSPTPRHRALLLTEDDIASELHMSDVTLTPHSAALVNPFARAVPSRRASDIASSGAPPSVSWQRSRMQCHVAGSTFANFASAGSDCPGSSGGVNVLRATGSESAQDEDDDPFAHEAGCSMVPPVPTSGNNSGDIPHASNSSPATTLLMNHRPAGSARPCLRQRPSVFAPLHHAPLPQSTRPTASDVALRDWLMSIELEPGTYNIVSPVE